VAAEYAAVGDVDPRVGEHLLDILALDGIAAYLRPSTDLHPVTRSSTLPGRPTDRLYADRTRLETARDYLARLAEESDDVDGRRVSGSDDVDGRRVSGSDDVDGRRVAEPDGSMSGPGGASALGAYESDSGPAPDQPSIDDEWAKIVAGFDAEVAGTSWPAAEDLPDRDPSERGRTTTPLLPREERAGEDFVVARPAAREEPSLLDGLDTFGAGMPDSDEDGYDPPAPPPVPRPSAPTALAVAGIVLGLIVFLKPSLLPVSESAAMLLGFAAVVGGFATLVWRLRPGDDDDDPDPDDGARV
jgi:hypothetical protein